MSKLTELVKSAYVFPQAGGDMWIRITYKHDVPVAFARLEVAADIEALLKKHLETPSKPAKARRK